MDETGYRFNFDYDYQSLDKNRIVFQFAHTFDTKEETGEISVEVQTVLGDENEVMLAEQRVRATFAVNPYSEVVKRQDKDGMTSSAPMLIDTFVNVVIGGLRGMLTKNLKGTPLEGCVIPLISMDVVRKMITSKE
jgi:hypothetical protein